MFTESKVLLSAIDSGRYLKVRGGGKLGVMTNGGACHHAEGRASGGCGRYYLTPTWERVNWHFRGLCFRPKPKVDYTDGPKAVHCQKETHQHTIAAVIWNTSNMKMSVWENHAIFKAGHWQLGLVCVTMSQCVSDSYFRWPSKIQLAPCRNWKCTESGTTAFGRNWMFTESAHFPTFGAETETETEIRSTSSNILI